MALSIQTFTFASLFSELNVSRFKAASLKLRNHSDKLMPLSWVFLIFKCSYSIIFCGQMDSYILHTALQVRVHKSER